MSLPLAPQSSISRKIVMALSGLLILGFLATHLLGNMLLFVGRDAFNLYAHKLTSTPLIIIAEIGLTAIFLYHIVTGIKLTLSNRAARGAAAYKDQRNLGESTLASRSMAISGIIIMIFLILHICTFKFGADVGPGYAPEGHTEIVRDLYAIVVREFAQLWYVAIYVISMICIGLHISHAFQSAFRTLGLSNQGYIDMAKKAGVAIAVFFAVAFSVFPVYFYACGGAKDAPSATIDAVIPNVERSITQ